MQNIIISAGGMVECQSYRSDHLSYFCDQTTFAEVLTQLIEKLKHSSDLVKLEPTDHLALFLPNQQEFKSGFWLSPDSTIEEYVNEGIIKSGVRHQQQVKLEHIYMILDLY